MFVVRDRIKLGLWRESFMKLVFLDHPTVHATATAPAGQPTIVGGKTWCWPAFHATRHQLHLLCHCCHLPDWKTRIYFGLVQLYTSSMNFRYTCSTPSASCSLNLCLHWKSLVFRNQIQALSRLFRQRFKDFQGACLFSRTFKDWQEPWMGYVALGWHAVKFAGGSTLQCGNQ